MSAYAYTSLQAVDCHVALNLQELTLRLPEPENLSRMRCHQRSLAGQREEAARAVLPSAPWNFLRGHPPVGPGYI